LRLDKSAITAGSTVSRERGFVNTETRQAKRIAAALMIADLRIMSHKAELKFNWARAVQRPVCSMFQINDAVASTSEDSASKDVTNGQITVTLADK